MTDYQQLFEELQTINYPKTDKVEMLSIPYKDNEGKHRVLDFGFFPAGRGTFDNDENISGKRIMILGQDFDCDNNYYDTDIALTENPNGNATWRNLLSFLKEVSKEDIHKNCFYTNAIMGVRKGEIGTGKSPAFKDENFIKQCQKLFLKQLDIQKPKAIFVLGKYVAEFLEPLEKEGNTNLANWKSINNFAEVDIDDYWKIGVTFRNGIETNLVILVHPSLRHANLRHRRLEKFKGTNSEDVEVLMVKKFLETINF